MRHCDTCDKDVQPEHAHCPRCQGPMAREGGDCPSCTPRPAQPWDSGWNRRPTPASDYRPPAGQSPAQSNYRYQRAVERNRARRGEHREPAND